MKFQRHMATKRNMTSCNKGGTSITNLLFLCSQNKSRSLTAETIFQHLKGYSVRSAGTENNSRVKVTPGMLGWADIIFCMEKKHVRRMQDKYKDILMGKQVVCLNISDDYSYMDDELIGLLESYVYDFLSCSHPI